MNKIILKIEFLDDTSLEMTFIYVDKRMLSQHKHDYVHFNSDAYDFVIYSRKNMKKGINSLRLPSSDKFKRNMKSTFKFNNDKEMYEWLKKFHQTLFEMNNKYTPFVKDQYYNERPKKLILSGEYWIL